MKICTSFNSIRFIFPHHTYSSAPTKTAASKISVITEDVVFVERDTLVSDKDKENIQEQETELQTMTIDLHPPSSSVGAANRAKAATAVVPDVVVAKPPSVDKASIVMVDNNTKDDAAKKVFAATSANTIEILSNELLDLNSKANAITEIIQTKEVSPKKTTTRFTPLVSCINCILS